MPTVLHQGRTIDLTAQDFVASGGQASVYARGQTAFKVFTDCKAVPPPAKLSHLRSLAAPGLITPVDDLTAPDGNRVGYTMRFLDGWGPVCRLFPPAYRSRHHIDSEQVASLVLQLRERVALAHGYGALVVDLNEMNAMVDPRHAELALIDIDSWQVPGFPATALAETVRDRHATAFSEGSDWFAFAVVSFQLFTGMHPFRGRHPTAKTLDARMTAHLSVFHPDVVVPPMVDLGALPPTWRDWYEAVFALGERLAPPASLSAHAIRSPTLLPGATLEVGTAFLAPGPVLGTASWAGQVWTWTSTGTYRERQRIGPPPPRDGKAFRTPTGLAFATLENGRLRITLADGKRIATEIRLERLIAHRGVLHGRMAGSILHVELKTVLGEWQVLTRVTATLSPHATDLYPGVAVTRSLGSTWLTMLDPQGSVQFAVPELDGRRVVDAAAAAGMAVLVTRESSGWARHIVTQDGIRSTSTTTPSAQWILLSTGIALIPTEDGLEILSHTAPFGPARAVNTSLPGPLCEIAGRPGFVHGHTVHTLTLRR